MRLKRVMLIAAVMVMAGGFSGWGEVSGCDLITLVTGRFMGTRTERWIILQLQ